MIYLDNSATTYPKPAEVISAVREGMSRFGFNPGRGGYRQSLRTAEKVYDIRGKLKGFFNTDSEESVIFTSGCTQALNMVIKGVLRHGDHAVISSMEHNAVVRPLYKLQEQGMIRYTVADVVPGDDDATLDNFRNAINGHTKLIVCTHASNVNGCRLPTERLSALAHQYGIQFCLDAAQSAGVLPIDMGRDGYDFVCLAGHKYLYGPMGIGALLLGKDNTIDPLIEGGTGSLSSEFVMPDFYPDRLEAGTLNIPGIIGLGAGINLISRRGIKGIYQKEMKLIDQLKNSLTQMARVHVYAGDLAHYDAPVLSLTVDGHDSEAVADHLYAHSGIAVRSGLHCAPLAHRTLGTESTGTVRIAPSIWTSENDIRILLNSLRKIR